MNLMVFEAMGFLETVPFGMTNMIVSIGIHEVEGGLIGLRKIGPEFFTGDPIITITIQVTEMRIIGCRIRHGCRMGWVARVAGGHQNDPTEDTGDWDDTHENILFLGLPRLGKCWWGGSF
jgi:hypothetical protein